MQRFLTYPHPAYLRLLWFLLLPLISACQPKPPGPLEEILKNRKIIVATRYAPTTVYILHDEKTGFEYDMVQDFAQTLGVEVEYLIKDTTSDILDAVAKGEAHMAAAGLTITNEREQTFLFGPVYQQVNQQVVCRRGGANPKDVKALFATRFKVAQDTSYAEELLKQQTASQKISADEAPPSPATPAWLDENDDTEDLLEQVWQGKLDCTVADSNIIEINQRYYPELRVRFDLGDPESLAWALPIEADELQSRIEDWFDDFKAGDRLDALNEKYYGYIELFDYVDNKKFNRRIRSRLPKYKNLFKKVAGKYDLDWTLLAAQAYQESHWNPRARSPTGVRGMMMLTLTTARALNVKSRLDPRQSIEGGARYLSRLRKRIPQSVSEPDRTWFALAAYNVGMGHIHDARTLAKRLNRDPDSWRDLTEVLPLLSSKKHYRTLKYGYARGREPVSYVRHIRDYQNVLQTTLN